MKLVRAFVPGPTRQKEEFASNKNQKRASHAGRSEMSEREIDLNLMETFPASDPPSWTLGTDHVNDSHSKQDDGAESEIPD